MALNVNPGQSPVAVAVGLCEKESFYTNYLSVLSSALTTHGKRVLKIKDLKYNLEDTVRKKSRLL